LIIVPLFFAIGAALHAVMARFQITPFNSLLSPSA
jgi:branched-chain amino acid transport system permease protein